jgi:hypothetical protein
VRDREGRIGALTPLAALNLVDPDYRNFGHVAKAADHTQLALELGNERLNTFSGGALEVLIRALAERGEFDEADALLREHDVDGDLGPGLWSACATPALARTSPRTSSSASTRTRARSARSAPARAARTPP